MKDSLKLDKTRAASQFTKEPKSHTHRTFNNSVHSVCDDGHSRVSTGYDQIVCFERVNSGYMECGCSIPGRDIVSLLLDGNSKYINKCEFMMGFLTHAYLT